MALGLQLPMVYCLRLGSGGLLLLFQFRLRPQLPGMGCCWSSMWHTHFMRVFLLVHLIEWLESRYVTETGVCVGCAPSMSLLEAEFLLALLLLVRVLLPEFPLPCLRHIHARMRRRCPMTVIPLIE